MPPGAALCSGGSRALVISEGLLIYLGDDGASALARDLSAAPSFRRWATDLASPGLLKMLQKAVGGTLAAADSPLKFAPREGPAFFEPSGWTPLEARSMLHIAAKLRRLSLMMRLFSLLPDHGGRKPDQPWGGICLFENQGTGRTA